MKKELQDLIAQGKISQALRQLLILSEQLKDEDLREEILLLSARYNEYEKGRQQDTTTLEEQRISIARINAALLFVIRRLPAEVSLSRIQKGQVLYHVPREMQISKESKCIVRIAYSKKMLVEGLNLDKDTEIRPNISVSDYMKVEIIDPNEGSIFKIRTTSQLVQFVDRDDFTEWRFYVKPLKLGKQLLELKITVMLMIDDEPRPRERTLEENIIVLSESTENEAILSLKPLKEDLILPYFIEKRTSSDFNVISSSKNVVSNNIVQAGGSVTIGDQNITESKTSRNLRIFLFVFVPLLAIAFGVLHFQYQKMQRSLQLDVALDNQTPNPHLPFERGMVILQYDGKRYTQYTTSETLFEAIPTNNRNKAVRLQFLAKGFQTIDTTIMLDQESLNLPIRRDDTYAQLFGTVIDDDRVPIEGAKVSIEDMQLSTTTGPQGEFSIKIPFAKQRTSQRLKVQKAGYEIYTRDEPIIQDRSARIQLIKN